MKMAVKTPIGHLEMAPADPDALKEPRQYRELADLIWLRFRFFKLPAGAHAAHCMCCVMHLRGVVMQSGWLSQVMRIGVVCALRAGVHVACTCRVCALHVLCACVSGGTAVCNYGL